jgi:hypothetical protein
MMRPANPQGPPTLAEVVHRAVAACDPQGTDPLLADLLGRFEDEDRPVTSVADVEQLMAEAVGALDPESDDPALAMAGAVTVYLAHRRDEMTEKREELLRLAARSEFDGHPPPRVEDWLAAENASL